MAWYIVYAQVMILQCTVKIARDIFASSVATRTVHANINILHAPVIWVVRYE